MSKVKFNADEMMVMAMFEQPTRTETMRYIEEVVPFVEDDAEVFPLVASQKNLWNIKHIMEMRWQRNEMGQLYKVDFQQARRRESIQYDCGAE